MVTQVKDKAMDCYRGDGLTTIEKFHIVSYVNRMIIGYERHYQRKLSQYPTMPSVAPGCLMPPSSDLLRFLDSQLKSRNIAIVYCCHQVRRIIRYLYTHNIAKRVTSHIV